MLVVRVGTGEERYIPSWQSCSARDVATFSPSFQAGETVSLTLPSYESIKYTPECKCHWIPM